MANATTERPQSIENLKVVQVGKFGIRVDEKTWYGVNEPLTPSHFQVGVGYKVSVVTSKTGKKYVNEIIGQEDNTTPVPSTKALEPKVTTSSAPSTRANLDEKSIQIQRQGLYQAALQSPVLSQFVTGNDVTQYLKLVGVVAEAGIAFVAER